MVMTAWDKRIAANKAALAAKQSSTSQPTNPFGQPSQPVSQSLSTGKSTVANPSPAAQPQQQPANPFQPVQQPVSQSLSTGKSTRANPSPPSVPSNPAAIPEPQVSIQQQGTLTPEEQFQVDMTTNPEFAKEHSGSAAIVTSTDLGLFGAVPSAAFVKLAAPTAITAAAQVGKMGADALKKVSLDLASNNAAKAATSSTFQKLGLGMGAASILVGVIGSYPFAGFIKEEALQTLSFGVNTAMANNDYQGALQALDKTKELLDPGMWNKLLSAIPFVNVVNELSKFYEAARTKVAIDEQVIKDKIIQQEQGETPEEFNDRIKDQEDDQYQKNIDYYNSERKKLVQWEEEAADADMKEDAMFWAKEQAKQRDLEKKDREAIAEFWLAYRKRLQKLSDDSRPSNLNFGIV